MKKLATALFGILLATLLFGCGSQDISPAHKGRMFDKTGPWALYFGGKGFEGPVLGPGTHRTGLYPEIRMIECAQKTTKEALTALTRDGVQFTLDVYVSYGANCDDEKAIVSLLDKLAPAGRTPDHKDDDSKADPNLTSSGRPCGRTRSTT